ncbi:hypothetical protein MASR1M12_00360 [Erysipelotrichia bacterium]
MFDSKTIYKNFLSLKNSDRWYTIPDEQKQILEDKFKEVHQQALSEEAKAPIITPYDQQAPVEYEEVTPWSTLKNTAKSVGRIPSAIVSTGATGAGAVLDFFGADNAAKTLYDTANQVDKQAQEFLPNTLKPIESVDEFKNAFNSPSNFLQLGGKIAAQVPEIFGTSLPMIFPAGAAANFAGFLGKSQKAINAARLAGLGFGSGATSLGGMQRAEYNQTGEIGDDKAKLPYAASVAALDFLPGTMEQGLSKWLSGQAGEELAKRGVLGTGMDMLKSGATEFVQEGAQSGFEGSEQFKNQGFLPSLASGFSDPKVQGQMLTEGLAAALSNAGGSLMNQFRSPAATPPNLNTNPQTGKDALDLIGDTVNLTPEQHEELLRKKREDASVAATLPSPSVEQVVTENNPSHPENTNPDVFAAQFSEAPFPALTGNPFLQTNGTQEPDLPTPVQLDETLMRGMATAENNQRRDIRDFLGIIDDLQKKNTKKSQAEASVFTNELFKTYDPIYIESEMNRFFEGQSKPAQTEMPAIQQPTPPAKRADSEPSQDNEKFWKDFFARHVNKAQPKQVPRAPIQDTIAFQGKELWNQAFRAATIFEAANAGDRNASNDWNQIPWEVQVAGKHILEAEKAGKQPDKNFIQKAIGQIKAGKESAIMPPQQAPAEVTNNDQRVRWAIGVLRKIADDPTSAEIPSMQQRLAQLDPAVMSKARELYQTELQAGRTQPEIQIANPKRPKTSPKNYVNTESLAGLRGKPTKIRTPRGQEVEGEFRIIEADQGRNSFHDGYSVHLQDRDTDKGSSREQIERIRDEVIPSDLVTDFEGADVGAPIYGINDQDGQLEVEIGNHRDQGIREGYAFSSYNTYRDYLTQNASALGFNPEDIKKMHAPKLIRVRTTQLDPDSRTAFANSGNTPRSMAKSAAEIALTDAKYLGPVLDQINVSEDGEINTGENRDFFRKFLGQVSTPQEQNRLVTRDGKALTQEGLNRVKNAIFASAYPNNSLVERLADSTDERIKRVLNGMIKAASDTAQTKNLIGKGQLHDIQISDDLAKAADKLAELRETETTVDEYLAQGRIFDDGMTPESKLLLAVADRAKSANVISDIMTSFNAQVKAIGNPNQGNLSGDVPLPSKESILDFIIQRDHPEIFAKKDAIANGAAVLEKAQPEAEKPSGLAKVAKIAREIVEGKQPQQPAQGSGFKAFQALRAQNVAGAQAVKAANKAGMRLEPTEADSPIFSRKTSGGPQTPSLFDWLSAREQKAAPVAKQEVPAKSAQPAQPAQSAQSTQPEQQSYPAQVRQAVLNLAGKKESGGRSDQPASGYRVDSVNGIFVVRGPDGVAVKDFMTTNRVNAEAKAEALSKETASKVTQENPNVSFRPESNTSDQATIKQPSAETKPETEATVAKPEETIKQSATKSVYTVKPSNGGFAIIDPEGKQFSWGTNRTAIENRAAELNKPAGEVPKATQPESGIAKVAKAAKEAIEGKKTEPAEKKESGISKVVAAAKSAMEGKTPAPKTNRPGKIVDFGEEIAGARKHLYGMFVDKMKDVTPDDIKTEPIAKTWPVPDYEKMLQAGESDVTVSWIRALREALPAKPRRPYQINDWQKNVALFRGLAVDIASGKITESDIIKAGGYSQLFSKARNIAELYKAVGHKHSLENAQVLFAQHSYKNGVKLDKPESFWTVNFARKKTMYSSWGEDVAYGKTANEAIEEFKKVYDTYFARQNAKENTSKPAKSPFSIYRYRQGPNADKYTVGTKAGSSYIDFRSFETFKEAAEFRDQHGDELNAWLKKLKEIPNERRSENAPRVGSDHRAGKDVTPEQFNEAFGFRGVQFGNWVEDKRRQKDLNDAYDALMDLAGILNIPSKAISLNGELGLAFGARGIPGASAHYEPDFVVINLTKENGAGSLAHEWWHALDNYFSRMTGSGIGNMTKKVSEKAPSGIRPEMFEAFKEIMRSIAQTEQVTRSKKLDRFKSKDYWSTPVEFSARAFESFLIDELARSGVSNDYLANIESESDFDGGDAEGRYPYLKKNELEIVSPAFRNFFQTVKTKETEKGVALYSQKEKQPAETKAETTKTASQKLAKLERIIADETEDNRFIGAFQAVPAETLTDGEMISQLMKDVFGKNLVVFKSNHPDGSFFHGTVIPSRDSKTAFIEASTDKPATVVAGHELLHLLKADAPDLYQQLTNDLEGLVKDFPHFKARFERLSGKATEETAVKEELFGDFLGDQMADKAFWGKVARKNPSAFKRIAVLIQEMFARFKNWLTSNDYGSSEFFSDIDAAQNAFSSVLADYSRRQTSGASGTKVVADAIKSATGQKAAGNSDNLKKVAGAMKNAYSYAGQKATGFKKAEEEGRTFEGPYDGKPRFEIDDSKAQWNKEALQLQKDRGIALRLDQALNHPELFESYPDLARVRTHINISETVKEPTGSFARSYYDPEREQTISPRIIVWARNLTDAKQVLMHEIQHAIQEKEGFARGGSPKQFEDESVSAARKRVASSYAKIRDEIFENASPEFRSAARKVNRAHDIKLGANEQSEEYFQARAEFAEKFGEEAEEYLMNSDFADQATRGEISFDANGKYVVPRNRYEQYHSLAGEIEARDVEFRSDLSAEERLEYPPFDSADVEPEDAIVKYSNKTSASKPLRDSNVPASEKVFSLLGLPKNRIYADYDYLYRMHSEYFESPEEIRSTVEKVLAEPDFATIEKDGLGGLVKEEVGDQQFRHPKVKIRLTKRPNGYHIRSVHLLSDNQLNRDKERSRRPSASRIASESLIPGFTQSSDTHQDVRAAASSTKKDTPSDKKVKFSQKIANNLQDATEEQVKGALNRINDIAASQEEMPDEPTFLKQAAYFVKKHLIKLTSEIAEEDPAFLEALKRNPDARTAEELLRDNKIEDSEATREAADQILAAHIRIDNSKVIDLIMKHTGKYPDFQKWLLKKARRVIAPYHQARQIQKMLFMIAERIYWNGEKMVASPGFRVKTQSGQYVYSFHNELIDGETALKAFHELSKEDQGILIERAKKNETYRQEFVNKWVPRQRVKLGMAAMTKLLKETDLNDKNPNQGFKSDKKLWFKLLAEVGKTITELDSKLTGERSRVWIRNMKEDFKFLQSTHGNFNASDKRRLDAIDNSDRSIASFMNEYNGLENNHGHFGYVHHVFESKQVKNIDPGTGFDAAATFDHPWYESVSDSHKTRSGMSGMMGSLMHADIAQRVKEIKADKRNEWMAAVEDEYGLITSSVLNEKGEIALPAGYDKKSFVEAKFGKRTGQKLYLPTELYAIYKQTLEKGTVDPELEQISDFLAQTNNAISLINQSMLYHTGKFARDLFSIPFHIGDFLLDSLFKRPKDLPDIVRLLAEGVRKSLSPREWNKETPESFGEYSETNAYQDRKNDSILTKAINALGRKSQAGSVLAALLQELNLAGAADLPIKRIMRYVAKGLADKHSLAGQERRRFVYKIMNEYAFDTSDLPFAISFMRGGRPDKWSKAAGVASRATLPFIGYITRLSRRLIMQPFTHGILGMGERTDWAYRAAEITRPIIWMTAAMLIRAGGLGNPPEEEEAAGGLKNRHGLDYATRTATRLLWSQDDNKEGGETYLATKGFGHLSFADSMLSVLKGRESFSDLLQEIGNLHPITKTALSFIGMEDPYSKDIPLSGKVGRLAAMLLIPQSTRYGPDMEKFWRVIFKDGALPDQTREGFVSGFLSQLSFPMTEAKYRNGKIVTTSAGIEALKQFGLNKKYIPFEIVEGEVRKELVSVKKIYDQIKAIKEGKPQPWLGKTNKDGKPMTEQQWLFSQGLFGKGRTKEEALEAMEKDYAERTSGLRQTIDVLEKKGFQFDEVDKGKAFKQSAPADDYVKKVQDALRNLHKDDVYKRLLNSR